MEQQTSEAAEPDSALSVAATVLAGALPAIGADAGYVARAAEDESRIDVVRVTLYSAKPVVLTVPMDAPYPLAHTIRSHQALVIADNEQLACDHPGLVRMNTEDHACVTLPLFDESDAFVGALNVAFDEPTPLDEAKLAPIRSIADSCARAMSLVLELRSELAAPAR